MRGCSCWLVVLLAQALCCVHDDTVDCGDGTRCPTGTLCRSSTCVVQAQLDACASSTIPAPCTWGSASTAGVCQGGVCLPGCGDGVQSPTEECDDGNFVNHDGCSSACRQETAHWTAVQTDWNPRFEHAAACVDATAGICGSNASATTVLYQFGGVVPDAFSNELWSRTSIAGSAGGWVSGSGVLAPPLDAPGMAQLGTSVLIFGGERVGGAPSADLWVFDGSAWTDLPPSTTSPWPSVRRQVGMASDGTHVVLVGGAGLNGGVASGSDFAYAYTGLPTSGTWTPIVASPAPPPRSDASLVWDDAHGEFVLFGGHLPNTGYVQDTWTLKLVGSTWTWTKLLPSNPPPARGGAAMAYDWVHGVDVLFGGTNLAGDLGDTWTLDAGAGVWTQVVAAAATSTPLARSGATLTWDGSKLVLFGGRSAAAGIDLADVWDFVPGSTPIGSWTEEPSQFTPAPRVPSLERTANGVILLGGFSVGAYSDSWSFDGSAWSQVSDCGGNKRYYASTAYVASSQHTLVFGGEQPTGPGGLVIPSNDQCSWNGSAWTQPVLNSTTLPDSRFGAAMTYDSARDKVVLFGGTGSNGQSLKDTWEYDDATLAWTLVPATGIVPSGQFYPMAYDVRDAKTIMFDGTNTWSYDGSAWSQIGTISPVGFAPRNAASLAYDPARGQVIAFGGTLRGSWTSDLHQLALAEPTAGSGAWQPLDVAGASPPPRAHTSFTYVPALHAFVVFGGANGDGALGDTWMFETSYPNEPDEICGDGSDNDGDGLVDGDDPDCQP